MVGVGIPIWRGAFFKVFGAPASAAGVHPRLRRERVALKIESVRKHIDTGKLRVRTGMLVGPIRRICTPRFLVHLVLLL